MNFRFFAILLIQLGFRFGLAGILPTDPGKRALHLRVGLIRRVDVNVGKGMVYSTHCGPEWALISYMGDLCTHYFGFWSFQGQGFTSSLIVSNDASCCQVP